MLEKFKKELEEILNNDPHNLLKTKTKERSVNADDRLLFSFQEINNFVKQNAREPKAEGGINEYMLYCRLKEIRKNKEKVQALSSFDEYELLQSEVKEIKSIDDIFENDDLGIFENDEYSIFNLKHVPKITSMPDYVARRKACKDFNKFEEKFQNCQNDLSSSKRNLIEFKENHIQNGRFFVLKGVMLFIDNVGKKKLDRFGKWDTRLRVIFENGTESNLLFRSLGKELRKDGKSITELSKEFIENIGNTTKEDQENGFIYILKSLSNNEKIRSIDNLYKIGFSKTTPEERIKNAKNDPTYLMSDVQIVATFKCFNLNPQKLEGLLHTFFGSACLNLDIFDNNNKRHSPREWFVAPLYIIEEAIKLILNGDIVNYFYDNKSTTIKQKQQK